MTKKKSGFLTFIFSLFPGAGEMYMGFMKMGVSLMALFWGIIFLSGFFGTGIFMMIGIIVWFYSFFHANNLRAMDDEEFYALEDDYLFHFDGSGKEFWTKAVVSRYRKIIAAVLILLGISILWNNIMDLLYWIFPEALLTVIHEIGYRIPQLVLGVGIIAVGVLLIRGKKQELLEDDTKEDGTKEAKEDGREADDQNS